MQRTLKAIVAGVVIGCLVCGFLEFRDQRANINALRADMDRYHVHNVVFTDGHWERRVELGEWEDAPDITWQIGDPIKLHPYTLTKGE